MEKAIENGQSRDNGNIGHTTHRGKKQIKKPTQHRHRKRFVHRPHKKHHILEKSKQFLLCYSYTHIICSIYDLF